MFQGMHVCSFVQKYENGGPYLELVYARPLWTSKVIEIHVRVLIPGDCE